MLDDIDTLYGKTALVTGSARRIGRAVAVALAESGCNVVVHYHTSKTDAEELAADIELFNVKAHAVEADLSDPQAAAGLIASAVDRAGPIDILINNAAVFPDDTLADCTVDTILETMQINALAPFILARKFAAQNRAGHVVNFIDSRVNDYDKSHVSYHLAKRTLLSLTKLMAIEFAPDIAVNGISPGLILPPPGEDEAYLKKLASTNPLNRYGDTGEIVRAVLFLLTSTFITGQIIYVDGGRHLKGNVYGH